MYNDKKYSFLSLVKCASGKKKMFQAKVVFANYIRIFCPDTAFPPTDPFKGIYSKLSRLHFGLLIYP
jgi:hypothetical protein